MNSNDSRDPSKTATSTSWRSPARSGTPPPWSFPRFGTPSQDSMLQLATTPTPALGPAASTTAPRPTNNGQRSPQCHAPPRVKVTARSGCSCTSPRPEDACDERPSNKSPCRAHRAQLWPPPPPLARQTPHRVPVAARIRLLTSYRLAKRRAAARPSGAWYLAVPSWPCHPLPTDDCHGSRLPLAD